MYAAAVLGESGAQLGSVGPREGREEWHREEEKRSSMKSKIVMVAFDTHASDAKAANDSRLFRPNSVCGTLDIVTTECRLPDDVDACKPVHKRKERINENF